MKSTFLHRRFILALLLSTLPFVLELSQAFGETSEVSCECEEASCGPCQIEVGTSFYSAKCGPANSRVKSCKKVACEAVENQKECLALFNKKPETPVTQAPTAVAETKRAPASERKRAGVIKELEGDVKIARGTEFVAARKDAVVFEGDLLKTGASGKAMIQLADHVTDNGQDADGSQLLIAASSEIRIDLLQKENKARKVAMTLLSGRIRNRVEKNKEVGSIFEVKTRTAVAGVRGTDFVTSYEQGEKEWVTKVQTIEGKVRLADVTQSDFVEDKEASPVGERLVEEGTSATLIVSKPKGDEDEDIKRALYLDGHLSPTFKLKSDEIDELKKSTEFASISSRDKDRDVASVESEAVCTEPTGLFNQCSFTCEGNPKTEKKKCRTDLPGVTCVRRLCRANGKWNEPSRLPASGGVLCEPHQIMVRDCGSYW